MAAVGVPTVAATPIDPPVDGKVWAFHLVNDLPDAIEAVLLESVSYEWGDQGNGVAPNLEFGEILPGASLELWRDDDNAAELRTSLTFRVRGPWGERKFNAEFGKLYKVKDPGPVPVLGRNGVTGHVTQWPEPPGTIEIDGSGVRRWKDEGRSESLRWDELTKIEIMTTSEGPESTDVYWILQGDGNRGCVAPLEADPDGRILARAQALRGFDNETFIRAMASTANARFVVWPKA